MQTNVSDLELHNKARIAFCGVFSLWNPPYCADTQFEVLAATQRLMGMLRDVGHAAPNDVQIDGDSIVLEWQYPDDRIVRMWVHGVHHGEMMTTYSDGKPTEWHDVTWGNGKITVSEQA